MAYTPATMQLLVNTVGGGPRIWKYKTADIHTDVDATDYFAKAGFGTAQDTTTVGLKVDDIVIVHNTSAPSVTIHVVTAVASDGDCTISVATLA